MVRLVIAGAGGHGREVRFWVESSPVFRRRFDIDDVVFVDDIAAGPLPAPLVGTIRDFAPGDDDRCLCAIGDPVGRSQVASALASRGGRFLTFVHDDALVASDARIGEGVVVGPRATISTNVGVGDQAHVNVAAVVSHDSTIGAYATLSPGSIVLGGASVGEFAYLGGGVTVLPRSRVGHHAMVGAQAVVTSPVPAGATFAGVPARELP